MSGYPRFFREVWDMAPRALLSKRWATAIARKGMDRVGGGVAPLTDVWGTFSMRNTPDGYELTFGGVDYLFPDDTTSMQRDADWTGANEARLIFTVVDPGPSGSSLAVESTVFATAPAVLVDAAGLVESPWQPVDPDSASDSWTITPSGGGSLVAGLGQLQVR